MLHICCLIKYIKDSNYTFGKGSASSVSSNSIKAMVGNQSVMGLCLLPRNLGIRLAVIIIRQ